MLLLPLLLSCLSGLASPVEVKRPRGVSLTSESLAGGGVVRSSVVSFLFCTKHIFFWCCFFKSQSGSSENRLQNIPDIQERAPSLPLDAEEDGSERGEKASFRNL